MELKDLELGEQRQKFVKIEKNRQLSRRRMKETRGSKIYRILSKYMYRITGLYRST
jgi:hypothetical protein